jgi:exopolysaccharide production protein ExoZ
LRYPHIQFLRFAAATSVLLYHSHVYWVRMAHADGWLATVDATLLSRGVTVFFAISGFVISLSLERSSIGEFVLHRVIRIYVPYFAAIILAISAVVAFLGSYSWHLLTVPAFLLVPAGPRTYVLGIEWTLVYEMFFYAVMAVLSTIAPPGVRRVVLVAWAAVILIANAIDINFTTFLPYYSTIALSEFNLAFIFGAAAFWFHRAVSGRAALILVVGGLAALVVSQLAFRSTFNSLLGCGLAAAALVLGASRLNFGGEGPPLYRWLTRCGDASYGVYLIHVPIITIFFALVPRGYVALLLAIALAMSGGVAFGFIEFAAYRVIKRGMDRMLRSRPIRTQPVLSENR